MKFLIHPVVREVVADLDANPKNWRRTYGYIHNDKNWHIWLSPLGTVALSIDRTFYGLPPREYRIWGGVTWLSSLGLSLSHHYLAAAIRRWEKRELSA